MRNQDANRPQRIKIIVITIIAAILIFIFGAWLITSAIKSVEKKNQNAQTAETSKTTQKEEKASDDKKQDQNAQSSAKNNNGSSNAATSGTTTTSPATQYPVAQQNHTVSNKTTDLPTTGPEDHLPTAFLICLASFLFFKNREIREKLSLQNS